MAKRDAFDEDFQFEVGMIVCMDGSPFVIPMTVLFLDSDSYVTCGWFNFYAVRQEASFPIAGLRWISTKEADKLDKRIRNYWKLHSVS